MCVCGRTLLDETQEWSPSEWAGDLQTSTRASLQARSRALGDKTQPKICTETATFFKGDFNFCFHTLPSSNGANGWLHPIPSSLLPCPPAPSLPCVDGEFSPPKTQTPKLLKLKFRWHVPTQMSSRRAAPVATFRTLHGPLPPREGLTPDGLHTQTKAYIWVPPYSFANQTGYVLQVD